MKEERGASRTRQKLRSYTIVTCILIQALCPWIPSVMKARLSFRSQCCLAKAVSRHLLHSGALASPGCRLNQAGVTTFPALNFAVIKKVKKNQCHLPESVGRCMNYTKQTSSQRQNSHPINRHHLGAHTCGTRAFVLVLSRGMGCLGSLLIGCW